MNPVKARNRALFLDRDGVINVDYGYVHHPSQVCFVGGIFDLCRRAHELGYHIVVITNQAGIGRGYYSQTDFENLMTWMKNIFHSQGCPITDVYWCPYHPTEGIGKYRKDSFWRKPKPGMILGAARRYGLDLNNSVLIGDKTSDVVAGQIAGVAYNLLYQTPALGELKDSGSQSAKITFIYKLVDALKYLEL